MSVGLKISNNLNDNNSQWVPLFSKKCLCFMILHTLSTLPFLTWVMKYNKMKDKADTQ